MKTFRKNIAFTRVPLTGCYRYGDFFQIYPLDHPNMPKHRFQLTYPFVLEYWIDSDQDVNIPKEFEILSDSYKEAALIRTKENKILSLLSVLTNNIFFQYNDATALWAVPVPDVDPEKPHPNLPSYYCYPTYKISDPGDFFLINDFSKIEFNPIEFQPYGSYYLIQPNIDFDASKSIIFPDNIDQILQCYLNLKQEQIDIIDSAIDLSASAMELVRTKKTLSLISSFTSLETMISLEYKDFKADRCESCGQLKYKVSKKFRDYLSKYLGDSKANKEKFNAYYTLRSKIIHNGIPLKTEKPFSEVEPEDASEEYITRYEILQIGKLGIINWLLRNII